MSLDLSLSRPATRSPRATSAAGRTGLPASVELAAVAALMLLAAALRWPYLFEIPRYTDELQEILWSLSIARGEMLPLTAVDSYYGALWSYILAAVFVLFGPSPEAPRLTTLVLGSAMVGLTYLFARDVAGRWSALITAALMATNAGHIVINSHTARSNSISPLLTTLAIWLLYLALPGRAWLVERGETIARAGRPWLLVPAGFVVGLALQTHISVIALLPGLGLYAAWRGRQLLRGPWPYLGCLAVLLGYANMLIYNLLTGFWSIRHARSLQEGYTAGHSTGVAFVVENFENLVQSLSRLLSSTIDAGDSPARLLYLALAIAGLLLLWRRGGALLGLSVVSIVLVLPLFNPRYGPILSGRYLIPLLPLAFTATAVMVVWGARELQLRLLPSGLPWPPVAALLAAGLTLFPLVPLQAYYAEAVADARTNRPLHELARAAAAGRRADEVVLLDEGLAQEQLGAGGNDLKAFRMLMASRSIEHDVAKVSGLSDQLPSGESALLIMEAKKRSSLPRRAAVEKLSPEVESASGSEHRYAVFRVTIP